MSYYNSFAGHLAGSGVSLDPITEAWLAQLTTSFGSNPSASYITALDAMIKGMRTDGDILLLDRFWIFAQEVQGYSRVSIVNPGSTQITETNLPTWTANQGYTGNASNKSLQTNFIPSVDGVNYTLNSASLGFYCRNNTIGDFIDIGCSNVGSIRSSFIYARYTGNVFFMGINKDGASLTGASTSSIGLFAVNRTASNLTTGYKDGASLGTSATASTGLATVGMTVMCFNLNGSLVNHTARQYSMAFMGSGSINQTNFYNRFTTFRNAIGF